MAGLELILCPECGKDLSSLEAAYIHLTNIKKKKTIDSKYSKIDIQKLDLIPNTLTYKDVLNFLNLYKPCCRSHKITTAKLKPLYYSY